MRDDIVYVKEFYTKNRTDVLERNWQLNQNLIRNWNEASSNLKFKKEKNKPFYKKEKVYNNASNELKAFEMQQNEFLNKKHHQIHYSHLKLGEKFLGRYNFIYNQKQAYPMKRYVF